MKLRVVVLGAGFGGLEVMSLLSDALGENLDLVLIDRNDTFYFGYSKLDVMFGRLNPDAVKIPYEHIHKTGVRFVQAMITNIDPETKRVTTACLTRRCWSSRSAQITRPKKLRAW